VALVFAVEAGDGKGFVGDAGACRRAWLVGPVRTIAEIIVYFGVRELDCGV
jgi:hypothetical protein